MESLNKFLEFNGISKEKGEELSPIVLAYIGDALFELFIRIHLVGEGEVKASQLHKKSISFVKAHAQAEILRKISNLLTEEEKDVVRRARNVKPASPPKNADIMDYRYATGFEALIGYLYFTQKHERLMEILKLSIN
ncbi:MAG: Mini-ribonuclease 3 [Deltaproteobacteria bacterium]